MALSQEQFERLKLKLQTSEAPVIAPDSSSSLASRIKEAFSTRVGKAEEAQNRAVSGQQGLGSATLQTFGQGAGLVGDVIGETIMSAGRTVLPKQAEQAIASGASSLFGTKPIQEVTSEYQAFKEKYPEASANIEAIFNIGSLIPIGAGAKAGVATTARGAGKALDTAVDATKGITNAIEGATDVLSPAVNAVKNIPSRIATNIDSAKQAENVIKSLPKTAQQAVRQGIEVDDIKSVLDISKNQKQALSKLYNATKDFVSGARKNNPIEAVGKPVVERLNTLKGQVSQLGGQLDEIAKGLKGKSVKNSDEVLNSTINSLDNLGVKITDDGLDFAGSNLEGLGSNETIISNVYNRLKNANDASDLHRLKKYIDNNVTFGKTSGGFTGEAENLLKQWRSAIDNALDTSFPAYNKVNTELASRLKPINNLKRYFKSASGLDEDLFELSAGQLMRRITSNVRSNPEIRQVLRDLDNATKVKGKTSLDIEALVDFQSTLEKYFPEIVGKNSLKGQLQDVSGTFADKVMGAVKDVAGQTEAVRRKAITDFLDDYFK